MSIYRVLLAAIIMAVPVLAMAQVPGGGGGGSGTISGISAGAGISISPSPCLTGSCTVSVSGATAASGQTYLMSGFIDFNGTNNASSEQKLRLFLSSDGLSWNSLSPYFLYADPNSATGGNVRDPSIIYYNSKWWIAYTNDQVSGSTVPQWSIASSPDLTNWSLVANINTTGAVSGIFHNWAPEFFLDSSGLLHVFLGISTGGSSTNFVQYESHATDTTGLTTWSLPVAVGGTGFPSDFIDAYVVSTGGKFYLFGKDDINKNLFVMSSTQLTTGYTMLNQNITANGQNCEGATVFQRPSGSWELICDQRVDQGMRVTISNNLFVSWTGLAPLVDNQPYIWNHGTVLALNTPLIQNLLTSAFASSAHPVGALVTNTSSQNVNSSSATNLQYSTVVRDDNHFTSSLPGSALTIPSPGWYSVSCGLNWTQVGTTTAKVVLDIVQTANGSGAQTFWADQQGPVNLGEITGISTSQQIYALVGDTISCSVFQDSGSTLSVTSMRQNAVMIGAY
jgi:hypothetical protein